MSYGVVNESDLRFIDNDKVAAYLLNGVLQTAKVLKIWLQGNFQFRISRGLNAQATQVRILTAIL